MLPEYPELLERMRADRSAWPTAAYDPQPDPQWTRVDAAYARRYGVFACLQYDRREEDHDLVRYLFEQEVAAREDDPFQGVTEALNLGGFLLAGYRRAEDVPLFWRAKTANFDTYCGFELLHLLCTDREATLRFLEGLPQEQVADFAENLRSAGEDDVARWWKEKQEEFPARIEDEDPLTLARRALALGAVEEARRWLDRWEAAQPEDVGTWSTLRWMRDELDQPEQALDAAQKLCGVEQEDEWSRASSLLTLPPLLTKLGRFDEAWGVLDELGDLLAYNPAWKKYGLARSIVEAGLDMALSEACPAEVRHLAWQAAHDQLKRGVRAPLVVLEKAEGVARLVGDAGAEKRYNRRADAERARIRETLGI